jgi:hypothetical protein
MMRLEGLLDWVQLVIVRSQSFNSHDFCTMSLDGQHHARLDQAPVPDDGTGTTAARIAANVRAGQAELITDEVNEERTDFDSGQDIFPIDFQRNGQSLRDPFCCGHELAPCSRDSLHHGAPGHYTRHLPTVRAGGMGIRWWIDAFASVTGSLPDDLFSWHLADESGLHGPGADRRPGNAPQRDSCIRHDAIAHLDGRCGMN